jgi:signal transduction histidine kinase
MTNVLLCDTSDGIARLQYELLRSEDGLNVEVTTDAFRAVEAAARAHPDVIVAELTMEGLGGAELIKRFRASSPSSRVVAWTSAEDPRGIAEVLAAGAAGYLLKGDGFNGDGPQEVLGAIRAAAHGDVTMSATVAALVAGELSVALAQVDELQDELAQLRDRVEQGTSAKADFLSNISHELRTPLTVAKGIAYVLKNPAVPESEREEFIDQLQASLDKLMGMVDEIITMSELERGTFELNLTETDLAPLVRHAVDEAARQYREISIEATIPATLPLIADGARIGSVVRELVDNACRYSPANAPVEVVARLLDEGVVVQVMDRGEGLRRSVALQSFDQPFSTGEATLRKEKAGAGAGLHLARQLVLEHGGILWADPVPSGGTRVSFCIPAHPGMRLSSPPAGAA